MTRTAFSLLVPLACTLGLTFSGPVAAQALPEAPSVNAGVKAKQRPPPDAPKAKAKTSKKAAAAHREDEVKDAGSSGKAIRRAPAAVINPCNIPDNNLPECH